MPQVKIRDQRGGPNQHREESAPIHPNHRQQHKTQPDRGEHDRFYNEYPGQDRDNKPQLDLKRADK